jgi:nitrous oxidase accessory protein
MRGLVPSFFLILLGLLVRMGYGVGVQETDLQMLIDNADTGSVITLGPGTYRGPVRVWKSLTITGSPGAIVDGGGAGDVIVVESDNVVLRGLRVVNSYSDVAFEPSGIKILRSTNVTVIGNDVENVIHGVYVVNSSGVVVAQNKIASLREREVSDRGHGVYLWYTKGVLIAGNMIDHVKDGVYSDHSYSIIIANNTFTNSRYGTHLMYSVNHTILDNVYQKNLVGIAIMYSCGVKVQGNTLKENRGASVSEGLFLREAYDVTISRNLIVGSAVGINIVATPYPRDKLLQIKDNVIAYNNIGVVAAIWARGVLEQNDLLENAQQFYPTPGSDISLVWRGNFWSNRKYQLGDRFLLVDPMETLTDRYPLVRAFMHGPGYTALSMMRAVLETNPRIKAVDMSPARSPHWSLSATNSSSWNWTLAACLLTFLPATAIALSWRNARRTA